jgi:hypothetical protein
MNQLSTGGKVLRYIDKVKLVIPLIFTFLLTSQQKSETEISLLMAFEK